MVSIFSSSRRCSDWFFLRRAVSLLRRAISSAVNARFRRVSTPHWISTEEHDLCGTADL